MIFVSSHVIITSVTVPDTFSNLSLVLLLLLAGSLGSKFQFQSTKKRLKRSPGKGRTDNLADGVTALAHLYALYSDRAHSFNQWQRALYPNFIINLHRLLASHQRERGRNLSLLHSQIALHHGAWNTLTSPWEEKKKGEHSYLTLGRKKKGACASAYQFIFVRRLMKMGSKVIFAVTPRIVSIKMNFLYPLKSEFNW